MGAHFMLLMLRLYDFFKRWEQGHILGALLSLVWYVLNICSLNDMKNVSLP